MWSFILSRHSRDGINVANFRRLGTVHVVAGTAAEHDFPIREKSSRNVIMIRRVTVQMLPRSIFVYYVTSLLHDWDTLHHIALGAQI
jgi:hypothetical protein